MVCKLAHTPGVFGVLWVRAEANVKGDCAACMAGSLLEADAKSCHGA